MLKEPLPSFLHSAGSLSLEMALATCKVYINHILTFVCLNPIFENDAYTQESVHMITTFAFKKKYLFLKLYI